MHVSLLPDTFPLADFCPDSIPFPLSRPSQSALTTACLAAQAAAPSPLTARCGPEMHRRMHGEGSRPWPGQSGPWQGRGGDFRNWTAGGSSSGAGLTAALGGCRPHPQVPTPPPQLTERGGWLCWFQVFCLVLLTSHYPISQFLWALTMCRAL